MSAHDHSPRTPVADALSAPRSRHLAFVGPRMAGPNLAEDIPQGALLRALRAAPDIANDERQATWSYRVLRNATIDDDRRGDVHGCRTRPHEGHDLPDPSEDGDRTLGKCFRELLPALRLEYASVLSALDLDQRPCTRGRDRTGPHLHVRWHRARRALRQSFEATCRIRFDHGCFDGTCETAPVV